MKITQVTEIQIYFDQLIIHNSSFISNYAFSRETKSLLHFDIDKTSGKSSLILNNAFIQESNFYNFVFIYSTIRVEIFNSNLTSNNFETLGVSYFITCEKNSLINQLITIKNSGVNTTLF